MNLSEPDYPTVNLTATAKPYLSDYLAGESKPTWVRLLQEPDNTLALALEDVTSPADTLFEVQGLPFVVESEVGKCLEAVRIDFNDDPRGAGFIVEYLDPTGVLEGLAVAMSEVDWGSLELGGQSAEAVPEYLAMLASSRPEVRELATALLQQRIGPLWSEASAGPFVLRFLLEFLRSDRTQDREQIEKLVELAGSIAQASLPLAPAAAGRALALLEPQRF